MFVGFMFLYTTIKQSTLFRFLFILEQHLHIVKFCIVVVLVICAMIYHLCQICCMFIAIYKFFSSYFQLYDKTFMNIKAFL